MAEQNRGEWVETYPQHRPTQDQYVGDAMHEGGGNRSMANFVNGSIQSPTHQTYTGAESKASVSSASLYNYNENLEAFSGRFSGSGYGIGTDPTSEEYTNLHSFHNPEMREGSNYTTSPITSSAFNNAQYSYQMSSNNMHGSYPNNCMVMQGTNTSNSDLHANSFMTLLSNVGENSDYSGNFCHRLPSFSSIVKHERDEYDNGQSCFEENAQTVAGIKREYAEDGEMDNTYYDGNKRFATNWDQGDNNYKGFSADHRSNYNFSDPHQGYGFSHAQQSNWSQFQDQFHANQQSQFCKENPSSPSPVQKAKHKKRTSTVDPNAERIRQENSTIEKYVRTVEPVGSISETFIHIERQLNIVVNKVKFCEPVTHVYNPTDYAQETHEDYVRKYCKTKKDILFVGMNPGPFGMSQNGVPFGEVNFVKNWLKIEGSVRKPEKEHPQRPILGFDCTRSEVSGSRFWGLFKRICGTPQEFFRNCFVHNYCPLALMSKTGKNITPAQLAKSHAEILNESCDQALCDVVKLLGARVVIGIGKYAQERARAALKNYEPQLLVDVQTLLHPSPINPFANKGWEPVAVRQLHDMGIYHMIAAESTDEVTKSDSPDAPSPTLPSEDPKTAVLDHFVKQEDAETNINPIQALQPTETSSHPSGMSDEV